MSSSQAFCNCSTFRTSCWPHARTSEVSSQYSRGQAGLCSSPQTESERNETAGICSYNSLDLTNDHDYAFRTRCSPPGLNMVNGNLPATPRSQLWDSSSWMSDSCPCVAITRDHNTRLNGPRELLCDPSETGHQRYKPCWVQTQIWYPKMDHLPPKVANVRDYLSKDKGCGATPFYSERCCSPTGRKGAGTPDSYGSTIDCGAGHKLACPLLPPSPRNSSATLEDEYRGHQKNFRRHGAGAISPKESQPSGREAQRSGKTIDLDEFWREYMGRIFQMKNKNARKISGLSMGRGRSQDLATVAASGGRCKQCCRHHAKRVSGRKGLRSHQSVIDLTEDKAVSASGAPPHSTEGQTQNSLTTPQAQRSFGASFNATKPVLRKLPKHEKSTWKEPHAYGYTQERIKGYTLMPRFVRVLPSDDI